MRSDSYGTARGEAVRTVATVDDREAVATRRASTTVRAATAMIFGLLAVLSALLAFAAAKAAGIVQIEGSAFANVGGIATGAVSAGGDAAGASETASTAAMDAEAMSARAALAIRMSEEAQRGYATRDEAAAAIAAAKAQKMTLTPFGLFPEECIHELPKDDAVIEPSDLGVVVRDGVTGEHLEFHEKLDHCQIFGDSVLEKRRSRRLENLRTGDADSTAAAPAEAGSAAPAAAGGAATVAGGAADAAASAASATSADATTDAGRRRAAAADGRPQQPQRVLRGAAAGAAAPATTTPGASEEDADAATDATQINGWIDYIYEYPGAEVGFLNGTFTVPNDPETVNSQVLFYFIGVENLHTGELTILQPVLTYGNGYEGWSMASWNCCPSGQTWKSSGVYNLKANDTLYGEIEVIEAGTSAKITSGKLGHDDDATMKSLTIATDYRIYDWMDVTMEVYYVSECDEMKTGWMTIDNIGAYTTNGLPVPPGWTDATGASECGGNQVVTDHGWAVKHTGA